MSLIDLPENADPKDFEFKKTDQLIERFRKKYLALIKPEWKSGLASKPKLDNSIASEVNSLVKKSCSSTPKRTEDAFRAVIQFSKLIVE